jgi:hypothetical protein
MVGHCEPVTWAAPVDDLEHQPQATQGLFKQLQEVISVAKPNLNMREAQKLKELITEFQDVFTTKGGEFGHTDRVCHWIATSDAQPIISHHADSH